MSPKFKNPFIVNSHWQTLDPELFYNRTRKDLKELSKIIHNPIPWYLSHFVNYTTRFNREFMEMVNVKTLLTNEKNFDFVELKDYVG